MLHWAYLCQVCGGVAGDSDRATSLKSWFSLWFSFCFYPWSGSYAGVLEKDTEMSVPRRAIEGRLFQVNSVSVLGVCSYGVAIVM